MQYIVADLEWNGGFSKKTHGYFNEIIEIGAVKLDEQMRQVDSFHAVIRPVVSRKLSELVSDLTNITSEELADGTSFPNAASAWRRWVGKEEAVLITWSTTDLSVLLENYRYFLKSDRIPFMTYYADLQAYVQTHNQLGSRGQQIGLARACEALGISDEGMEQHRALDDSRMTAAIAQKTFEKEAFRPFLRAANEEFYARLNFKPYYIRDINSPDIARNHLRFRCADCGRALRNRTDWRFHHQAFYADMTCRACGREWVAHVQFRKKYDSVEVKRKLLEPQPNESAENIKGEKKHENR